ncbi:MAG: type II/IV secretion system protein [Geminicoccaceae bacterium]|nr:type II/IV secretion system protein [Geminicoccaceae bacterium]
MLQLFRPRRTAAPPPTPSPRRHPALALLIERARLSAADAERAAAEAQDTRDPLPAVLARLELVSGQEWMKLMAEHYGLQVADPDDYPDTPILPEAFSSRFLRQRWVLPLAREDDTLWLGMADPADEATVQAARLACDCQIVPVAASVEDLKAAYARFFESGQAAIREIVEGIDETADGEDPDSLEHLIDQAKEAPVVRLVNQLLNDALTMGASDIHVEPYRDRLQVRYRIHGHLREIGAPPARLAAAVISRIKILAKLDIAERRLPQDGRTQLTLGDRRIDLRVATIPTMNGESLVLRLLDTSAAGADLESVGLDGEREASLREQLAAPHGMILVTGPTGSGKTTTLYAGLRQLDAVRDKIISIEDPVEYQIEGVTQIQVRPEIDLTFARILRSVVRHDPNVIMVGETRDGETAEIAVHAALTGHLLLTTLHTNSAAGAVARLLDMGVEPYLLASVLRAIVGQRLVGKLCPECREPHPASEIERTILARSGLHVPHDLMLHRPVGCRSCNEIGFTGRIGIFELLLVDDAIRQFIRDRAPTQDILDAALRAGMTTMFRDGARKAMDGLTTFEEVCRVTEEA